MVSMRIFQSTCDYLERWARDNYKRPFRMRWAEWERFNSLIRGRWRLAAHRASGPLENSHYK